MSHAVTTTRLDAAPTFPGPSVGLSGISLGTPDEPYTIRVVDMLGALITDLPLAEPGDITETLNAPDQFDITFPKDAYTQTQVAILGRAASPHEIQVLLGNKVLAWGPAIAPEGGSATGPVKLTCAGVDWYFPKRNIDAPPVNLLPNAGFESDLAGWNYLHGHTDSHVDASIITDPVIEGTKAVKIESTDSANPSRILGIQSDAIHYTTGANGEVLTLTYSFIIEEYLGPAYLNGGIEIEGSVPGFGGPVRPGINQKSVALYKIDHTTPRNAEVRAALSIRIPPHVTWAIQVILFGLKGAIVWDDGGLIVETVVSTRGITGAGVAVPLADVSRIVRMLVTQALTARNNKSDLHIGLSAPSIGVKLARSYAFKDHTAFDQAFNEFLQRDDCFDYAMHYTATTRTLHLYPIASGGRGTDHHAAVTLTYGAAPVTGFVPHIDGGSTITQAAELGDATGQTREEAWATNAAPIGGTVLQGTINAPAGSPHASLAPLAQATVDQRSRPPRVLEVTIDRTPVDVSGTPTILQDLLGIGDHVTLDIADGWWTFTGIWRIVQRVRHCRARTMTYTLNEVL